MNALTQPLHSAHAARRRSLVSLLRVFGYEPRGGQRNFWQRHAGELEWIFRDCQLRYRELAKRAHPDCGGSHDASASLNAAWSDLENRFRRKCRSLALPFIAAEKEPRPLKTVSRFREAAVKLGVRPSAIYERLRAGWPLEKALTAPLSARGRRAIHKAALLIVALLALSGRAQCETPSQDGALGLRFAAMTAGRTPKAQACLLSWTALPPLYQVVSYRVYQAESVAGPFALIGNAPTNSITLVVEPGEHFWHVTGVNFWTIEGEASTNISTPPLAPTVTNITVTPIKAHGPKSATIEFPPTPFAPPSTP